MSDSPGRVSGSRRLRKDLAVKVAKQTANAIYRMHTAGFVHYYLTTSNILFRFSENVFRWSDDEVYNRFGSPQTEEVWTTDGRLCKPNTPASLVQPIENSKTTDSSLLEESIVIIDFGQSYAIDKTRFEGRAGLQAEIWALGCAIFEIRAGSPLFDTFLGSDIDVLKQTVETLGRLPDPWWGSFVERTLWFEEDGEPKTAEAQERAGLLLKSFKTSIREKLRTIGTQDDPPYSDEGSMVENAGVMLCEEEVEMLGGLLDRMLKYLPEERIGIEEVVQHSWVEMNSPSKR